MLINNTFYISDKNNNSYNVFKYLNNYILPKYVITEKGKIKVLVNNVVNIFTHLLRNTIWVYLKYMYD